MQIFFRSFQYDKHEFWVVVPEERQPADNYSLALTFSGNLTGSMTGFYRSLYRNTEGREVAIATSKFQPTYARKASMTKLMVFAIDFNFIIL